MNVGPPKVEEQTWYHGFLPRSEFTELLTDHGDWLMRCTEKENFYSMVVSVNLYGEIKHIMLRRRKNGWIMPDRSYANICEMVETYHKTRMALNET
ncbi:MAG: hypothetical protein GY696_19700, partial [Gammaproteobacteria bacterium]|nr:hypothetical protein [Gammaproteobacteria bacterium]